jgi:DNA-binding transcriptional MerR regulator
VSGRSYLSIGDVLTLLRQEFPDVTISKIRFLESQGLVNPERTPSGYRKFYEQDVERLRWVLRQQRENFLPLKVIKDRLGDETSGSEVDSHPDADHAEPADVDGMSPAQPRSAAPVLVGQGAMTVTPPRALSVFGSGAPERPPTGGGGPERLGSDAVGLASPSKSSSTRDSPAPASSPADSPGDRADTVASHRPAAKIVPGPSPRFLDTGEAALAPTRPVAAPDTVTGGSAAVATAAPRESANRPAPNPSPGPAPHVASAPSGSATSKAGATRAAPPSQPAQSPKPASSSARPPDPSPAHAARSAARIPAGSVNPPGQAQPTSEAATSKTVSVMAGMGGASLTLDELSAASGLELTVLNELCQYGLLTPSQLGGAEYFDEEALAVANLVAGFARFGVEPRHLRLYKNAAEREAGFIEQIVLPLVRQRNPEARAKANETADELIHLGQGLRSSLLRNALRHLLGG